MRAAVRDNKTKQAISILKVIRRHGYTSGNVVLLSKRLSELVELRNSWNRVLEMNVAGLTRQAYNAALLFTTNALYHDRAIEMIDAIRRQRTKGIIQTATTLYAGGSKKQSEQLLSDVVESDPSNREARDILAMIRTYHRTKQAPARKAARRSTTSTGDEAYKNGDFREALKLWSGTRRKADRRKVALACTIKKYLAMGESAERKHDYAAAVSLLGKAEMFTALLGISGSVFGGRIDRSLAMTYGILGQRALSEQRYRRARQYLEKAFRYKPGNKDIRRGFSLLNEQAGRLYKKAYAISGANMPEACILYRHALLIAQRGSDIYNRVKSRIVACGR